MAWAAEYTSAEEMMAAYAARRQRISSPSVAVVDNGIDLKRPAKGFRPAERKILIGPAEVVSIRAKPAWAGPGLAEMDRCEMPEAEIWRRYIDGFCLVLTDAGERYCPELNIPDFWSSKDEDLAARAPRLKGGVYPKNATEILMAVALKHGLTKTEILSKRRRVYEVLARQEAYWWLNALLPWSLPQIGRFMGGLDHTTILHGVRRHQARLDAGEA